jgi:hypothetical protein
VAKAAPNAYSNAHADPYGNSDANSGCERHPDAHPDTDTGTERYADTYPKSDACACLGICAGPTVNHRRRRCGDKFD